MARKCLANWGRFKENLIVEIKCPMRGRRSDLWAEAAAGLVPEHYRVQAQHQLMVSGARVAHFWVFDGTDGLLVEIARDELVMARIRHAWDAFQVFLDADQAPPLNEEDSLLRDDAAWLEAARSYVRLKKAYDDAAANSSRQSWCYWRWSMLRVKRAAACK